MVMRYEVRSLEEPTILHFENDPKNFNTNEEIEIRKATTFDYMLNTTRYTITPLYKILQPPQDQTATGTDSC